MPKKISRDTCLIKYRKFPLRNFENKTDDEIFFYPKVYSEHWLKLEYKSTKGLTKKLSIEITKLFKNLNVEDLIFFGDYNRNWITKFTKERNDYKPLIGAIDYFKKHKVTNRFKGALKVKDKELTEFIKNFYILTRVDGGFCYYYFLDEQQNILGFIHYSGEVCFQILTEKTNELFLTAIKKTDFKFIRDNAN